ncbi:MAG: nuclear transport factor 2 family protein [Pseudomonadota bacterium]
MTAHLDTLQTWHDMLERGDMDGLNSILAEECVFHSPVVHTPQAGRDLTRLYLTGAFSVLSDGFRYVKEVVSERHAVLEFTCQIDGLSVNGVDIMTFDDDGRIIEFKVMVRPLKAINIVHAKMRDMLEQLSA